MTELPEPTRDFVGYGRTVPVVRWPGGARLALNIVVNYEEGSERSWDSGDQCNEGLGEVVRPVDTTVRDLATESVYEYGSRAGVFRILRILEDLALPATFFAAAVALERNPDAAGWIAEAGHDVCAHGYRWSEDWLADRDDERRRIAAAYESIRQTTGRAPTGWYSRWMASPNTRELLVEHGGFAYDSNAYNDDLPYWADIRGRHHLVVPYTLTYNDNRYLANGLSPSAFVDYCIRAVDELAEEGETAPRMMSIGVHARWTGQPARASALREILKHAVDRGDIWIARREDIAATFREQVPSPSPDH